MIQERERRCREANIVVREGGKSDGRRKIGRENREVEDEPVKDEAYPVWERKKQIKSML